MLRNFDLNAIPVKYVIHVTFTYFSINTIISNKKLSEPLTSLLIRVKVVRLGLLDGNEPRSVPSMTI